MPERKVWSVYARRNYEGPWTFINWYTGKRAANDEADRLRFMWDERKVIAEFEYEARSRTSSAK